VTADRSSESVPPDPDVEIGAAVRAKKLRFRRKPKVEVTTHAHQEIDRTLADEVRIEGEGGSQTERENLPDEVEPDVTYRDVRIRWKAGARIVETRDPSDRES
jgi:hypothetical protein